jgi:flagellar biosynthesis protein
MKRLMRDDRKAVAIRYAWSLPAPFIVASGRGRTAERIREIAAACGIPMVPDPELADSLIEVDAGSFIPEEVYGAVATILAFVVGLEEGNGVEKRENGNRGTDGVKSR